MIKINLETVRFEKDSAKEFAEKLDKVQARTQVRMISYEDACIKCYDMVHYLNEILPSNQGIGATLTYIVGACGFSSSYRGIPMGTRIVVVKHTSYAEVKLDRYYTNGQHSHEFSLDISNCSNEEKVKNQILSRALRYYENANRTKINL